MELALLLVLVCAAALVGGLVFGKKEDSASGSASPAAADPPLPQGTADDDGVKCFADRDELVAAVEAYMGDRRQDVMDRYGDIRTWRVGQVTDFTAVFRDQKEFNEPLDGWVRLLFFLGETRCMRIHDVM